MVGADACSKLQHVGVAGCAVVFRQAIDPVPAPKQVGVTPRAPLHNVIARAAVQDVIACIAVQCIVARTAVELVYTVACAQRVFAVFAVEQVVSAQALQSVVACTGVDSVCAVGALDGFAGVIAGGCASGDGCQIPHRAVGKLHLLQRVAGVAGVVAGKEVLHPHAVAGACNAQQQGCAVAAGLHVGGSYAVLEAQGVELARRSIGLAFEHVLPVAPAKQVGVVPQAPLHDIVARATIQDVVSCIAVQCIIARTAIECIGTVACAQGVFAVFAVEHVVAFHALEGVVAGIASHGIGLGASLEGVIALGAHDGVGHGRHWCVVDGQRKVAAGAQPPWVGGGDAHLQGASGIAIGRAAQGMRGRVKHQPGGQGGTADQAGAVGEFVGFVGVGEGGLGDEEHQRYVLDHGGVFERGRNAGRAVVHRRWRVRSAGVGNGLDEFCQGVAAPAPLHLEAAAQLDTVIFGVAQQPGAVAAGQLHVFERAAAELDGVVALAVGGAAHHACVVACIKQVGVVARAPLQLVFAAPAMQEVGSSAAFQGVVPVCTPQLVVILAAQQVVCSGAAVQGVGTFAARELVAALLAQQKVVARFAIELVVALATVKHVFLGPAIHLVVACVAIHEILARIGVCHAQVVAVHDVVARAAKQGVASGLPSHPVGPLAAKQAVIAPICSDTLVGDQAHRRLEFVVVLRGGRPDPIEGLARGNRHRVQAVVAGVHLDHVLPGIVPYEGLGKALGIVQCNTLGIRCVMPIAQDQVVARTALGDILPRPTKQHVASSRTAEGIVAQLSTDPVAAFVAVGPGRFVGAVDVFTPKLVVACAAHEYVAVLATKGNIVVLDRGAGGILAGANEVFAIAPHHHVVARKGHDVVTQPASGGDHVVKGAAVEAITLGAPAKGHALGRCCAIHGQVGHAVGVHHSGHALGLLRWGADAQPVVAVLPVLEVGHCAVLPCACVLGRQAPDTFFGLAQLVGLVGTVVNVATHARHLGKGASDGFAVDLEGVAAAVNKGVYACEAGLQQVGVGIGPAFEVVCAVFAREGVGACAAVEAVFLATACELIGLGVAEVDVAFVNDPRIKAIHSQALSRSCISDFCVTQHPEGKTCGIEKIIRPI